MRRRAQHEMLGVWTVQNVIDYSPLGAQVIFQGAGIVGMISIIGNYTTSLKFRRIKKGKLPRASVGKNERKPCSKTEWLTEVWEHGSEKGI